MTVWIVAIEYAGADIVPWQAARRRPVLEHAYDLEAGRLAHGGDQLRVGFPEPARGWPVPSRSTRCVPCTLAVDLVVMGVVAEVVGRAVVDISRWAAQLVDAVPDEVLLRDLGPRPSG